MKIIRRRKINILISKSKLVRCNSTLNCTKKKNKFEKEKKLPRIQAIRNVTVYMVEISRSFADENVSRVTYVPNPLKKEILCR